MLPMKGRENKMTNTNKALKALDEIEVALELFCKMARRQFKGTRGEQHLKTIRAALTANTLPTSGENVSNAPDVVVIPREELDGVKRLLNFIIRRNENMDTTINAEDALTILQKHGEKK
jgi:hypothetical protein